MEETKAKLKFKFGEVFRGNEPIARWLIAMAIISNDLKLTLKSLIVAMKDKETSPFLPEALYFVKLTSSHLYEASKLVEWALSQYRPIYPFLESLPPEAKDELQKLKRVLFEDAFSKSILRPLRDSFFHYPNIEDSNFSEHLENISDIETYYYAHTFSTFSRAVFADEVATKLMFGNQEEQSHQNNMNKARDATIIMLRFCDLALAHYFSSYIEEGKVTIEDADDHTHETWIDSAIKEIIAQKYPEIGTE
jgi:hypothetical protein